ncbi:hypothetical protein DL93DRAFT_2167649 [Clavulina sp. PMI_390]|nr:hypothetical protein DL93DRAFT_2167649 [Clavulina sp. PMI_390]
MDCTWAGLGALWFAIATARLSFSLQLILLRLLSSLLSSSPSPSPSPSPSLSFVVFSLTSDLAFVSAIIVAFTSPFVFHDFAFISRAWSLMIFSSTFLYHMAIGCYLKLLNSQLHLISSLTYQRSLYKSLQSYPPFQIPDFVTLHFFCSTSPGIFPLSTGGSLSSFLSTWCVLHVSAIHILYTSARGNLSARPPFICLANLCLHVIHTSTYGFWVTSTAKPSSSTDSPT